MLFGVQTRVPWQLYPRTALVKGGAKHRGCVAEYTPPIYTPGGYFGTNPIFLKYVGDFLGLYQEFFLGLYQDFSLGLYQD